MSESAQHGVFNGETGRDIIGQERVIRKQVAIKYLRNFFLYFQNLVISWESGRQHIKSGGLERLCFAALHIAQYTIQYLLIVRGFFHSGTETEM